MPLRLFGPVLVLLLLPTAAVAADIDVLLVGNSYTSAGDLAGVLEGMLEAVDGSPDVRTEARAPGGTRFPDHLAEADGTNGDTQLRQWLTTDPDGWHAVVFQDQSQVPGFYDLDPYYDASRDAFVGLDLLAQAAPGEPASVLFMTWGRFDGDSQNAALFPDFSAMQARLEEGYRRYAQAVAAPRVVYIAPVGLAFAGVHDRIVDDGGTPTDPDTCFSRLYSADGSHPSAEGTWIAGATIAATLTGVVPEALVDACGDAWRDAVDVAVAAEGAVVLDGGDDDDAGPDDDDAVNDDDSGTQTDDDDAVNDDDSGGQTVSLGADREDGCGCQAGSAGAAGASWLVLVLLTCGVRGRRRSGRPGAVGRR